jgi:5-methylcytosine-specific restriction protein A
VTPRHYAWGSDTEARKNLVPLPMGFPHRCGLCDGEAGPITLGDYLTVFGRRPDGGRSYPHEWSGTFLELTHAGCEPDCGYNIPLRDLVREGAETWLAHLRGKRWWAETFAHEVQDAYRLAQRLAARAERKAAPAAERVSRNPRSISTGTRTRVMERDGFRCRRCGATPDRAQLVVDHVVPVAKGGTADPSNLQTLCEPCNAGKSDRDPHPHDLQHRPGGDR